MFLLVSPYIQYGAFTSTLLQLALTMFQYDFQPSDVARGPESLEGTA